MMALQFRCLAATTTAAATKLGPLAAKMCFTGTCVRLGRESSSSSSSSIPEQKTNGSSERITKLTTRKNKYPRIYTRTGDGGKSSLYTGERRNKSDPIFEALGTTDELSSHIGMCLVYAIESGHPYVDLLQRVQCLLQDIGSCLATPSSSAREAHIQKAVPFHSEHTKELEEWIDKFSLDLPPLQNFILPGGGRTSASLHVARSVCRRAERKVAPLVLKDEVDKETLKYLNRLSDLLFTLARTAAKLDKKGETIYCQPQHNDEIYQSGPDGVWKKKKKAEDKSD